MTRPDARNGLRAVSPADRLTKETAAGRESSGATIPGGAGSGRVPARVAAWLRLSDERDVWLRRVYDSWREGYRAGFEAGDAAGARRATRERHIVAMGFPLSILGPSWAELERRRWGPGGRAHFADPRPGDFAGRQHG